jgi:hypothetical protein
VKAKVITFSSQGDTTLAEWDTETATDVDMQEVNRVITQYEKQTGAQPFDIATTGERIEGPITREHQEVLMVHPIAGG